MVFQRIISRFPGRSRIFGQPQRLCLPNCNVSLKFSGQSPNPLCQIGQKRDFFSGISENYQGPTRVLHNAMPRILGNLSIKLGFAPKNSLSGSLKYANYIHSVGPKEFERGGDDGPIDTEKNSGNFKGSNQRLDDIYREPPTEPSRNSGFFKGPNQRLGDIYREPLAEPGRNSGFFKGSSRRLDDIFRGPSTEPGRNIGYYESLSRRFADMDKLQAPSETGHVGRPFARGFERTSESRRNMNSLGGFMRCNENYPSGVEQNPDIVHIKIMRNNTFVTVTDSKGNKKLRGGASSGCLPGGAKASKYSAEATAEHVGRVASSMGLKSVVVKVNGCTFFKKKKLAILAFRDGFTNSRSDKNPIVYIEDTTRKPHNGCRLKKQRRV